jgi:REP element-mobilizing transposase RayT
VKKCWLDLPNHYKHCKLDEFIIMPNHIHGIIIIENNNARNDLKLFHTSPPVRNGFKPFHTLSPVRNGFKPFHEPKQYGLSEIIRGFKTFSSRQINETNPTHAFQWKKSFYDHVIRNEESLNNIRQYIINNPLQWVIEQNNKENLYYYSASLKYRALI